MPQKSGTKSLTPPSFQHRSRDFILLERWLFGNSELNNCQRRNVMAEERVNRVTVEDLPEEDKELSPEEAKQIQGGLSSREGALKRAGTDDLSAAEEAKKSG
jgi:hypothetical protein